MAAPTLFAAGALFAAASGTNITAVIPASCVADDIMVLVVSCNDASTFTTPTDWTQFGAATNNANHSMSHFWKRHDGSETDPSVTTSATGSTVIGLYGRIYVFRGCTNSGTPMENVIVAGPTTSTTPTVGGVNVSGEDRLVVGIALVDDNNTWSSGNPPASWSECGSTLNSSVGGDCMSAAISRVRQSGTYGSVIMGTMNAADYWNTIGFALIPEVINRTASLSGTGTIAADPKIVHHSRTGSVSGTGTFTATGSISDPSSEPILVDTEVNPAGDVTLTGSLFAGDLAIVTIAAWNSNSATISTAISGNSLTWTVRSINSNNANKHSFAAIAYATVTSDISASILVDMTNAPGSGTTGDYAASLYRLPGGSAVQFKTGSGDTHSGNPTTFGITLDSAPSADNGTLMVFAITEAFDGQCTIDLKPGWTELEGNEDGTLNDLSYIVGWRENSTSTSVQVEFSKDEYREVMVAVEFALSAAAVTRTGSLSGTGTFSATPKVIHHSRTASLTGTGTLTATGSVRHERTGSLTGTGTFTATGAVTFQRTGSLSGTGTLASTGAVLHTRTASLVGSGVLNAAGNALSGRTGSLSGSGTFTASGRVVIYGDGALNGTGTFTATGKVFTPRTASISGTGTFTATPKVFTPRTGSLNGTGTFAADPRVVVPRTAALVGNATLTATGLKITLRTASLVGTGTFEASGTSALVTTRTGSISGSGILAASGMGLYNGSLQGTGTFTATGNIIDTVIQRTGSLQGTGTFTAYGTTPGAPEELAIGVFLQAFDPLNHIKRTVISSNSRIGTKP